jgi:hypothetical protein
MRRAEEHRCARITKKCWSENPFRTGELWLPMTVFKALTVSSTPSFASAAATLRTPSLIGEITRRTLQAAPAQPPDFEL